MKFSFGQLLSFGLRLASLSAKFFLTLYMGKFFGLSEMGIYGLALSASIFFSWVVGFKLDYVVGREIVGAENKLAAKRMRDQFIFYSFCYVLLALLFVYFSFEHTDILPQKYWLYVAFLSIAEGYATFLQLNLNSLGMPVINNFLFFIRSASWVAPVMVIGYFWPEFRNIDFVFNCWLSGVSVSVFITLFYLRQWPWPSFKTQPFDFKWLKKSIVVCFMMWVGNISLAAGTYADRFIIAKFLDLELVGVVTFYASFAFALLTLNQSGVLAFAYPRFITNYKQGHIAIFWQDVWRAGLQSAALSGALALLICLALPFYARYAGKELLLQNTHVLYLVMAGAFLRCVADIFYYVLYARHQDRPLWLGNIVIFLPFLGANLIMIPLFGIIGFGINSFFVGLSLLAWRLWYVKYGKHGIHVIHAANKGIT